MRPSGKIWTSSIILSNSKSDLTPVICHHNCMEAQGYFRCFLQKQKSKRTVNTFPSFFVALRMTRLRSLTRGRGCCHLSDSNPVPLSTSVCVKKELSPFDIVYLSRRTGSSAPTDHRLLKQGPVLCFKIE